MSPKQPVVWRKICCRKIPGSRTYCLLWASKPSVECHTAGHTRTKDKQWYFQVLKHYIRCLSKWPVRRIPQYPWGGGGGRTPNAPNLSSQSHDFPDFLEASKHNPQSSWNQKHLAQIQLCKYRHLAFWGTLLFLNGFLPTNVKQVGAHAFAHSSMFKSLPDNQILKAESVTQMSLSEAIPEEQGLDLNRAASLVVWLAFSALPIFGSLWAKCPFLSQDPAAQGSVLVLHPDEHNRNFRQIKLSWNTFLKYFVGALPHNRILKSYFLVQ